jgi:hypothetical protein
MSKKKREKTIRCQVCGVVATQHKLSFALCDNIVCDVVRQEIINEEIKQHKEVECQESCLSEI